LEKFTIVYDFLFEDHTEKSHTIDIDSQTMEFLPPKLSSPPPAWTALENNKCSHCPLNSKDSPQCPVALNLSELVHAFQDDISHTEAVVRVTSQERTYMKQVPLQEGILSIFGLVMATSSCPYMKFLRPLARYHLPFANADETIVRSVSMYLLGQYFVAKKGGEPDLKLTKLEDNYKNTQIVNVGILSRIRNLNKGDADSNALTILHNFSQLLTMAISRDLTKFEYLFR
jgi:hypothetical protein